MSGRYYPSRFPAVSCRHRDLFGQKSTGILFEKGNEVITGLTKHSHALIAQHAFAVALEHKTQKLVRIAGFQRQNIVASMAVGYAIHLTSFFDWVKEEGFYAEYRHRYDVRYKPKRFPGVQIWWKKVAKSTVVLIVFATGAIVIAGAKSMEELYYMTRLCCDLLERYAERPDARAIDP